MKKIILTIISIFFLFCSKDNKEIQSVSHKNLYLDTILDIDNDIYSFLQNYRLKKRKGSLFFIKVYQDSLIISNRSYFDNDLLSRTIPTKIFTIDKDLFFFDFNMSILYKDTVINEYKRAFIKQYNNFYLDSGILIPINHNSSWKLIKKDNIINIDTSVFDFLAPRIEETPINSGIMILK